jgi:carboxyl-terminal processing protease
MNKRLFPLVWILLWCANVSMGQTAHQVAVDAYMVTRMAEKFHTQPRVLDTGFSVLFFDQFINELDDQHFLFLKSDMERLDVYRYQLDGEIRREQTGFLDLAKAIYQQRIRQADSLIDRLSEVPVDTTMLQRSADTLTPVDLEGMRSHLALLYGQAVLENLQEDLDSGRKNTETYQRKRVRNTFKRGINRLTQSPGGLNRALDLIYLNTLAGCYDPHSSFFSATEKEQFEQELGNSHYVFGFSMKEDEDGTGVLIDRVEPGTPAFRAGIFSKGDQLVSIQWAGKDPIDLTDATLDEVNDVFDASNHDVATIRVRKPDGSFRQVNLSKQKDPDEETELYKVKGWVLKGEVPIGYISLPSFYTEWDNEVAGSKGCAQDVARKIHEMAKDHIRALIIDLRYNGGGSLDEAIELAGLFIPSGPVALARDRDEKPYVLRELSEGKIYKGPLIILVNGYSASAAEVIASCLQDYNRALIMGTPTFGKATAQVVLPLDTNIELDNLPSDSVQPKTDGYLKLTVSRLYRVTGSSVQATGVQPDILLPMPTGSVFHREGDDPLALRPATLDSYISFRRYPLTWDKYSLQQLESRMETAGLFSDSTTSAVVHKPTFSMQSPPDEVSTEGDDPLRTSLLQDPYVEMAFLVACRMAKASVRYADR